MINRYALIFCLNTFIGFSQNINYRVNNSSLSNNDINYIIGITEVTVSYSNLKKEELLKIEKIPERNAYNFKYFPNPVNDKLYFTGKSEEFGFNVKIYNEAGQLVYENYVKENYVDLSSLIIGSYVVKTDLKELISFKIIKI